MGTTDYHFILYYFDSMWERPHTFIPPHRVKKKKKRDYLNATPMKAGGGPLRLEVFNLNEVIAIIDQTTKV